MSKNYNLSEYFAVAKCDSLVENFQKTILIDISSRRMRLSICKYQKVQSQ